MTTSTASPTLIEAAKPVLIRHEGLELRVYHDTLGIPTAGVGLNMLRADARELIAKVGADYDALLAGTSSLTSDQCDSLLTLCIIGVLEWLTSLFPDLFTFTMPRQVALIDMAFNLGYGRFLGFQHMIAAIKADPQDWRRAAREALASQWATQVGKRADEDAAMLENG
jgi:GH24 family phage-related lysozyme (muramidase)